MDGGFKALTVYQRSYAAAKAVYGITESYCAREKYGVTDQMRRGGIEHPIKHSRRLWKKR